MATNEDDVAGHRLESDDATGDSNKYVEEKSLEKTGMTFWQENYHFMKDVYDMRHTKMLEWMENVEKAIARIMADKVYTLAEFKRERDNFHTLCKDLDRTEVKTWLQQMLETLLTERAKEERKEQASRLDGLIARHEKLLPNVHKTQIMVELYWRCYAYGDELSPHIEFLDSIMLTSTRDIAPSCVENVEELIDRQERALTHLENKKHVVTELIAKGKALLHDPDKPKFLDAHVARITDGWEITRQRAEERLQLLRKTKEAWTSYSDSMMNIQKRFGMADEEIAKLKKRFNLQSAQTDLEKRKQIFVDTKSQLETLYKCIETNFDTMTMTLPNEKKEKMVKEIKAITDRMDVLAKFEEKMSKIESFVCSLTDFDTSLNSLQKWMKVADQQLEDIKEASKYMGPEERVGCVMELWDDVQQKLKIIEENKDKEQQLMPQGERVPTEAVEYHRSLEKLATFASDLEVRVKSLCDAFSADIQHWAEYKMGIKKFEPWLITLEKQAEEGLPKPNTFEDANKTLERARVFAQGCLDHVATLEQAERALHAMTSYGQAEDELRALHSRFEKVRTLANEWVEKMERLVKEWELLDATIDEINTWVDQGRVEGETNFSLEKMENTLGELKNVFKVKETLVHNL